MALIVGTIKRIEALKQITETFKSQEVVLETEEQFSQTVSVQFQQDKTDLLTNFQPGQKVKVEYYLKGKEVIKDGKAPMVFNTLAGWKIEKAV